MKSQETQEDRYIAGNSVRKQKRKDENVRLSDSECFFETTAQRTAKYDRILQLKIATSESDAKVFHRC